jgi:hypothetical protein
MPVEECADLFVILLLIIHVRQIVFRLGDKTKQE